ncbi:hypothetical protein [Ancylobacter terrae]|uniref:hypothetical protein n=1 Tax=Ancylobacter sp. sgz301288 TaxID=3342077 RepID=UPI00385987DF
MTDGYLRREVLGVALSGVALALAGCQTDGTRSPSAAKSGGSRALAFESIDGPPQPVFERLVSSLSAQAEGHQLKIVSRDSNATYRVRGYLAAHVEGGNGSVDWAWDVFDGNRTRILRVSGTEAVGKGADVWDRLDQPALDRIATQSLDEIASRLDGASTLPAAASPSPPAAAPEPEPPAEDGTPVAAADSTAPPLAFAAP